jgi:hypothetical protein
MPPRQLRRVGEMFMRSRFLLLCVLPVALLLMAFRQSPLVDPPPIAVSPNVKGSDVAKAIKIALIRRGWATTTEKPGEVDATLRLRDFSADIAVDYDAHAVQIKYVGSTNLKYEMKNGQQFIHTNYLGWIHNLVVDIQANLIMFES